MQSATASQIHSGSISKRFLLNFAVFSAFMATITITQWMSQTVIKDGLSKMIKSATCQIRSLSSKRQIESSTMPIISGKTILQEIKSQPTNSAPSTRTEHSLRIKPRVHVRHLTIPVRSLDDASARMRYLSENVAYAHDNKSISIGRNKPNLRTPFAKTYDFPDNFIPFERRAPSER